MKNDETLKNNLGLSHEEAAMYFEIHKSQWSMFVSGKRVLPLAATLKLTELLQYLQTEKPFSAARQQLEKAEVETLHHKLQHDLLTIKIKQYKVAQKINKIEISRTECFAALEVAQFLESQEEKNSISSFG